MPSESLMRERIGGLGGLVETIYRNNAENEVAFSVLIKDSLPFLWLYPKTKDNINTTYHILISSIKRPDIYFKQRVGKTLWGIRLPFNRENAAGIDKIKTYINKVKKEVDDSALKITQENIPEYLKY